MKSGAMRPMLQALRLALAGTLVLGLAACGESTTTAGKTGKGAEGVTESTPGRFDPGSPTAAGKSAEPDRMAETTPSKAGRSTDDAALAALVKSVLVSEPGLKASSIQVEATNGIVTLHGTTESGDDREKAVQVASRVTGVKSVDSKLIVIKGS
jgi:osmotically-inducible protein OsmY